MKNLRCLLFPFLVLAELLICVICWSILPFSKSITVRLVEWAFDVFPDISWYKER